MKLLSLGQFLHSATWFKEPTIKVWSNMGQLQLRYFQYEQMSPGQMLPGQMSLWQLESVQDSPRNYM